jgi:hypothetical protein
LLLDYPLALAESSFFSLSAVAGAHTAAAANRRSMQRNSPLDLHLHHHIAQEVIVMEEIRVLMDPEMR